MRSPACPGDWETEPADSPHLTQIPMDVSVQSTKKQKVGVHGPKNRRTLNRPDRETAKNKAISWCVAHYILNTVLPHTRSARHYNSSIEIMQCSVDTTTLPGFDVFSGATLYTERPIPGYERLQQKNRQSKQTWQNSSAVMQGDEGCAIS